MKLGLLSVRMVVVAVVAASREGREVTGEWEGKGWVGGLPLT